MGVVKAAWSRRGSPASARGRVGWAQPILWPWGSICKGRQLCPDTSEQEACSPAAVAALRSRPAGCCPWRSCSPPSPGCSPNSAKPQAPFRNGFCFAACRPAGKWLRSLGAFWQIAPATPWPAAPGKATTGTRSEPDGALSCVTSCRHGDNGGQHGSVWHTAHLHVPLLQLLAHAGLLQQQELPGGVPGGPCA